MANKTNTSKNFFENMLDAQQQVVDTMVSSTKKLTNGNTLINETIDKGTDFYKKAVNSTKETLDKMNGAQQTAKEEVKNSSENITNFFTQWYQQQINWAKQMSEYNQNFLKNSMSGDASQMFNTQNVWNMWQQNPMMKSFETMNPSQWQQNIDAATENMKAFWSQFQNILNSNYSDLYKNFQNGTLMDSYKGMFNMTDGFSKFYEMWMPMMKSMQDKTFNMDVFNKNFNMDTYKEFMNKYFSFVPQNTQEYFDQMKNAYGDMMKNNAAQFNGMFGNMKNSFQNMMPQMQANPFAQMLSTYQNMTQQMQAAVSPFAKIMTPTNDTKNMQAWVEIMDMVNIYNIKNASLQYMVYQNGSKVMENIAQSVMHKIENGEEVNSMLKLYQEWLNTSDKMFVELFETDEYSQLMAEVSSLQLRIKKAIEIQTEKMFANVPVATRSEMDEVYKTIYDLKKQVRQLQSMLDIEETPEKTTTTAKKASSRKK